MKPEYLETLSIRSIFSLTAHEKVVWRSMKRDIKLDKLHDCTHEMSNGVLIYVFKRSAVLFLLQLSVHML